MIIHIKTLKVVILTTFCMLSWTCIASAFTSHTFVSCFRSCHNLHGSPSGDSLLAGVDTELTCLICHDTVSPKNLDPEPPVAAIHDPGGYGMGNKGYITCRECHDPHSNEDNVLGGENYKLVGSRWDPELDPSKSNVFAYASIRKELPTSDYNSPIYNTVVFEENLDAVNPPYDSRLDFNRRSDDLGVCEVCHEPGPPSGSGTDLANHQWGECTGCHKHEDGFLPHQCVECHDTESTFALKPPDAPEVINSALLTPGSHMLLMAGGSYPDPADSDWARQWTIRCLQCHPGHGDNSDHDGDGVFGYELDGFVKIANNVDVGISYNSTGGIFLGGLDAIETTEAEICWGCHDQNSDGDLNDTDDISEWDGQAYNGYTVSTDNWTIAEFDAPNGEGNSTDVIPTRPTRSVHTANLIDSPDLGLSEDMNDVRSSSVADNITNGVLDGTLADRSSIVLEKVKYIRCSYCHDVHDTVAGSPTKGETVTAENGQSFAMTYLRGTWLPNPYTGMTLSGASNAPEVPPWDQGNLSANSTYYSSDGSTNAAGVTRTTTSLTVGSSTHNNWGHRGSTDGDSALETFVNLPRLWTTSPGSNREGGFFIDQNTSWPTRTGGDGSAGNPYTFLSVSDSAGLCTLCHDEGTDSLDYYKDGVTLWRGSNNGHSNSALGGSGAASGNDIFSGRRDLASNAEWGMQGQPAPDDNNGGEDNSWADDTGNPGFSDKPNNLLLFGKGFNDETNWQPGRQASQNGYIGVFNTGWYGADPGGKQRDGTGDYTTWFATASGNIGIWDGGEGSTRAHNFTCSKCHTPHASGLPALLMTNCLDIDVATWYAFGVEADNDLHLVGPASTYSWARTSAGNCHRKEYWNSTANGNDPTNNTGWIKLAPNQ